MTTHPSLLPRVAVPSVKQGDRLDATDGKAGPMRMRSLLRSVVLLAGILGSGSAYCCSESAFYLAPNLISIKGQCASRDEVTCWPIFGPIES
jgi:hypothetical protein